MISVIVPIYNVEEYLNDCLQSILNQTYKDYEVILVDDCSSDSSLEICKLFVSSDSRFKLVKRDINGGLSAARNTGLSFACGDYIAFIDSDDRADKNYLDYLLKSLTLNNSDIAVCGITEILSNNRIIRKHSNDICVSKEEALKIMLYQREFDTSAWGKLYKKELFSNVRFTENIFYEDLDIMYRLFEKCNRISYTDITSYIYIHHKKSILRNGFNEKHLKLIDISESIVDFYQDMSEDLYKASVRRYVYSNFFILNMLIDSDVKNKEYMRLLRQNIIKSADIVLYDKQSGLSDKLGVVSIIAGLHAYRFGMKLFRKLRGITNEQ